MKNFLLVFGKRLETIKMLPLVKAFEKKNSKISKVCVGVNVLLDMKNMLSAFHPSVVLAYGDTKSCQRTVEFIKSV